MSFAIARPHARDAGGLDASHDVRIEHARDDGWTTAGDERSGAQGVTNTMGYKSIKLPVAGPDASDGGCEDVDGADGNAGAKRVQFGVKIDVSAA